MKNEIEHAIAKFKEDHPELNEILEKFHISDEVYTKAMSSITVKVPAKPTYALTVGGSYNVNVSKSN
jgi:ABC-type proline/glycine betaine transport system substrate-binding protein